MDEVEHAHHISTTPKILTWDPNFPHFAHNESMIDWERNIIDSRFRKCHCIDLSLVMQQY